MIAEGLAALKVLLVDDDEDDYLITREMLTLQDRARYGLEWRSDYDEALAAIREDRHDVYLIDYHLGTHTGLELIRAAFRSLPKVPVIVLTGHNDYEVDLEANGLGVTDFLIKQQLDPSSLERSIRYAVSHQRAIHDLARSEERYAVAASAASDGVWDWDLSLDRIFFSSHWHALLGQADSAEDEEPAVWFALVHADDLPGLRNSIDQHLAGETEHLHSEFRIRHADRNWRRVVMRGAAIRGTNGEAIRLAGSISDVTHQRASETKLQYEALHDPLTGLSNRVLFTDRVDQVLHRAIRDPKVSCTVLFLDIDRFKHINDTLGHDVGDRLLVAFAGRLAGALRPGDTVGRLGGDEFTILLSEAPEPAEALAVAERLHSALEMPFSIKGNELFVTVSVGIALGAPPTSAVELLCNADSAMYDSKRGGLSRSAVFDETMRRRVLARLALESDLRRAIQQSRLRVHYQPIVDLTTGRICAIEALARWPEAWPEVSPFEFIPIAEETGLISGLGLHVLDVALTTLAAWRADGLIADDVRMSVNLSRRQLNDPGLPKTVHDAIAKARLTADALLLEITEGTLMNEPDRMQTIVSQLCQTGVGLHLDDFGTGHSSLAAIHDYPVDALKIDRRFITSVDPEALGSEIIVNSTVALAHGLGIGVVAEGIESGAQLRRLQTLGCERGQGFLFSEPRSRPHTETLLRDWPATWAGAISCTPLSAGTS